MKNKFILGLMLFIFVTVLTPSNIINANSLPFTVEKLTVVNGTIKYNVIDSANRLDEALKKMNEQPQKDGAGKPNNYVVKWVNSKSKLKIVATNRGFINTYPEHEGQVTVNITDRSGGFVAYVNTLRIAQYYQTEVINGVALAKIKLSNAVGYIDIRYVDIIPAIYIENNIPVPFGGSNYGSGYMKTPQYTSQTVGGIKEIMFKHEDSSSFAPYGIAPSWMKDGVTYYSFDGIYFYTDLMLTQLANPNDPYYNYYQYLPARSKSKVTAAQLDAYTKNRVGDDTVMAGTGRAFVHYGQVYDMNALLIYSVGALESAFGTSYISRNKFNLFGWNAVDTAPGVSATAYNGVVASIEQQMSSNLDGYLNYHDWRFHGPSFGNKGAGFNVRYASDPYWGQSISQIAYAIDKANGLQDYNAYQIGVLTESENVVVYNGPSTGSGILTKRRSSGDSTLMNLVFETRSTNLHDQTVIVRKNTSAEANGFYEVHLVAPTLSNKDWDSGFGYILKSQVKLANPGKYYVPSATVSEPSPVVNTISEITGEVVKYKVNVDVLNVRQSNYATSTWLGSVKLGQVLEGVVVTGNWLKIKLDNPTNYANGKTVAYVSMEFLDKVTPSTPAPNPTPTPTPDVSIKQYETLLNDIRVRSAASTTNSNVLGYLKEGTIISGVVEGNWIKFTYNGQTAYVAYADPNSKTPFFKEVDQSPTPTPTPPVVSGLGDVNQDGVINVIDYGKIARHILGKEKLTAEVFTRADVNKDGVINVIDYGKIARHILGKELIK